MSNIDLVGIPAGSLDRFEKLLDRAERIFGSAPTRNDSGECLKSSAVMKRLGFKDAKGFHAFVKREAVPHIRLNCRNIVFPRAALLAWEAKRSIGKVTQ